jgi:hypothetical protein
MHSRKRFVEEDGDGIEPFICGIHLRSIARLESCTTKQLILGLKSVGKEYIQLIARVVSTTLTSLFIIWKGTDSTGCYEALNAFFEHCDGIRNLGLELFDFGNDSSAIS